ncbi:hypothetical protein [Mycobacterium sp. 050134]|uniref:hypothetical protein n=1 Tax=Mycobacterium sp. 050134 TaxID=3096111 RepID=UPI002EDB611D
MGLNRPEIVLLVVSPRADPDQAHAIMMTAAHPSDASTVETLVSGSEKRKAAHNTHRGVRARQKR